MPTLLDKVDQFWRGVGDPNTPPTRAASRSSRPPLPPSASTRSAASGSSNGQKVTGRAPVPANKGTLQNSRKYHSSLSLNKSPSKLSKMGGSIVDIYEFCKSQASRKLDHSSQLAKHKRSKSKLNVFGGSTLSVCAYPSIKEEVIMPETKHVRNCNEKSSAETQPHDNIPDNKKTTFVEPQNNSVSTEAIDDNRFSVAEDDAGEVDQWTRDGPSFERLTDHSHPEVAEEDIPEAVKMRWHKLGASSSSASTHSDRRPKSFDYAQRKAWMKLYHDMEVSQATGHSTPRYSRSISKGSITHLHLQEVSSDPSSNSLNNVSDSCKCPCDGDQTSSSSTMMRSDISSTSPSLFKRFSKTFSLRFGSGTNVSKQPGEVPRKSKSKGASGSSPDLLGRQDYDGSRDKVNGKMRKSNVKSVRGDKCQSGDSGIGMEEQAEPRHISNLRRIRSDYISPTTGVTSPAAASYANRGLVNSSASALAKMSLVEIPDHSWDENTGSPHESSGSSDTASYEDLVDAKLDGDDGFSSSDEGRSTDKLDNPTYYHSLPHRKHNKRRLKETGSANSCGVPQEDNSIRAKVVREIIHTEQNYVKTLNDIVQGFLKPCRARNDLFSSRTVQNIFSNIEDILRLHVKFLEALKSKVDDTFVSRSNVGEVFTSWAERFSLYSEYCCNNPISVATVRSLVQFPNYAEFFEACRRLQMMDKLPLHGFLLRPIQRICQYHLQLNELLKHTEGTHPDYRSVVDALDTMKSVANKINDTQRQFDSLQEIIRFQNSIDGWEGPNLVDRNAVILRKGELVKITHGRKQKEIFVAVLNKDLIYCKKDFMKKNGYVFDGRIDLNLRMWVNIDSNEEDEFFGMVHNSWRIYSPERRAWILFTAPSPTEKRKWISALEKTKEDIHFDPKLREMAVVTTALADSEMLSTHTSHGHHSNTLPKSSKKSKGKHLSVTKGDPDAMLIEVGKLKRSTMYASPNPQKEGTSKFYV